MEAARAALACRLGNRLARACGELAVTGAGGYRAAAGQVVVLLAGTLHIRAGGAIPIAIRVVLVPAGGGWHGEVTLP